MHPPVLETSSAYRRFVDPLKKSDGTDRPYRAGRRRELPGARLAPQPRSLGPLRTVSQIFSSSPMVLRATQDALTSFVR